MRCQNAWERDPFHQNVKRTGTCSSIDSLLVVVCYRRNIGLVVARI